MPVKRRLVKGREHRITEDAIAAYRAGDSVALHRALGLRPWEQSPLLANTPEPPEWSKGGPWHDSWFVAHELRVELQKALKRK